jgi:16S rRNA (guanine527-N7)-methyltransferase
VPFAADDEVAALVALLRRGQERGLVGPGPVEPHLDSARGFAEAADGFQEGPLLDLGSGAGLPGLVLAVVWPASRWFLVDGSRRSTDFLLEAVPELGLADRVSVITARAEEAARDPALRSECGMVVVRSLGPPAVTAECAAGFLAVGGHLVVSEPPDGGGDRWPPAGLALLGQRLVRRVASLSGHHFAVIEQVTAAPDRYPRRTGVPARRLLF